jgi:hypothetical protein
MPTNVGKYDKSINPKDHMGVFINARTIERWTMLVWCHMFVETLIGSARSWYDNLPVGRIDSFEDLHNQFKK